MNPRDHLTRRELAFYLLVIVCGLLVVGRLDYADAVIAENERLHATLEAERDECAADIEHLDHHLTRLEM